ncbi:hypothetical protein [Rhodovulum sp. PH10]|uniref:hypothetical protein n=1 Tax=Rhodovulum sp. PH10 TaxID=1187851 RepID=UPI0012FB33C3|nr:hypothetical protein [Rhodovulum sp. PH10]
MVAALRDGVLISSLRMRAMQKAGAMPKYACAAAVRAASAHREMHRPASPQCGVSGRRGRSVAAAQRSACRAGREKIAPRLDEKVQAR